MSSCLGSILCRQSKKQQQQQKRSQSYNARVKRRICQIAAILRYFPETHFAEEFCFLVSRNNSTYIRLPCQNGEKICKINKKLHLVQYTSYMLCSHLVQKLHQF
ncbi:uncharacterized protein LOC132048359 [Lycium ferocissimum]|uniref:uncharacterized protein LOC132048359 n=1 Tax=Lycium ferocissimum TaxID=112874 RepID=UPI002815B469|nr:uncharacterized protein LOC132048359 [Lycium ferocissimum]